MALPHFSMKLIATADPAIKNSACDNTGHHTWSNGTNHLVWDLPTAALQLSAYMAMWLQRSSVDNTRMYPQIETPNVPAALPDDSFWSTIKQWSNSDIDKNNPPLAWDDTDIPHSTFYYYRLILHYSFSSTSPPFTQVNWKAATIVQPFDLSICTTDTCTIPQGCQTLVWDAPVLTVPYITGSHVPDCGGGAPGCYKVHVNWIYTPVATDYDIYKSNSSPNSLSLVANTATSPLNGNNDWYDSDLADRTMWYQFRANRANGSVIPSNIVQISY